MSTKENKSITSLIVINSETNPMPVKDVLEASRLSQIGKFVDIKPLIPMNELEGDLSFQNTVQKCFNHIAKVINSPELLQFKSELNVLLEKVTDQDFIFDLEGTLTNDVQNLGNMSERVIYVNPWTKTLIEVLIKNHNRVGFWTSATTDNLTNFKQAMSPELALLPAISRDDFQKITETFQQKQNNLLSNQQVIEIMQSFYPSACEENLKRGIEIFADYRLESFNNDPTYFLRNNKYPELLISANKGFFIDDNDIFIDSATRSEFPKERAIKCNYYPNQNNLIKISEKIALVTKN